MSFDDCYWSVSASDFLKAKLLRQKERRQERDIRVFAESIRLRFPGCPADEASSIAKHACEVGSGRVGRSSTADDPVRAAVVAHVRHEHTDYDELLNAAIEDWMGHRERQDARLEVREEVREQIDTVLLRWEAVDHEAELGPLPADGPHSCPLHGKEGLPAASVASSVA